MPPVKTLPLWISTRQIAERYGLPRFTLQRLRASRDPRCPRTYRIGKQRFWELIGVEALIQSAIDADRVAVAPAKVDEPEQSPAPTKPRTRRGRLTKREEIERRRRGLELQQGLTDEP